MPPVSSCPQQLWEAIDGLLGGASPEGILYHGLGSLAVQRASRLGVPPPALLAREERAALLTATAGLELVRRVRASCDGPLILFKGLEVARLYPPNGRRFADIDVLTPRAAQVQDALLAAGFVVNVDGQLAPDFHLPPLLWPTLPLEVEVHSGVNWPRWLTPPNVDEIVEAAVPSRLGIDGLLAPSAVHHSLMLAAHACELRPLRSLRDLIDIAVVSAEAAEDELERAAAAWGMVPIWRTTRATIDGLFFGGPQTVPLRSWARHLGHVRDRTVLESHLERLFSGYWLMPAADALVKTVRALRDEVVPSGDETWRRKLARSLAALRHPAMGLEHHDAVLRAAEGREAGAPDGDDNVHGAA